MKWLFSLICFSLFFTVSNAQVKAVEDFIKANPDLEDYFVYQSTLRMLNLSGDAAFNKLIKGVRKINAYVAEGGAGIDRASIDKLLKGLDRDNFESLIQAKDGTRRIDLMSRENGAHSYFVLVVNAGDDFAVLEMDGMLDLKYIDAVKGVDMSQIQNIIMKENSKKDKK